MNKDIHPPPAGFAPPPPYAAHPYPQSPSPPPPPQPQAPQMVIVTGGFGPVPQVMTCPRCHANVSTRVETSANTKTHLMAFLLCIFGLWCCAPCPYCMDSCLSKKHYCPSCGAYLGSSEN